MRKIKEILHLNEVEGDVGVEIEVEGYSLPEGPIPYWRVDTDGSLKAEEAYEYVLKKPVKIEDLKGRLAILKEAFEDEDAEFDEGYRAGVHVHVNVQNLTVKELFNYIVTSLVVEELLLTFCAKHRIGNHFCLRASEAEYMSQLLWKCAEDKNLMHLRTDDIRYSATNLKPVVEYGSIEFRAHESTYDFDKINTWAEILVHIREASLGFDCPKKIMEEVSIGGYEGFVKKVFGPHADFFLKQPNWSGKIRKGILVAQDIAYSREWGKVSLNIFKNGEVW
jgi:hypothetical protein